MLWPGLVVLETLVLARLSWFFMPEFLLVFVSFGIVLH